MEIAAKLAACLGGPANVASLDSCPNRLRVQVANPGVVDVPGLKAMGAYGVVLSGQVVQIVIGSDTATLADAVRALSGRSCRPSQPGQSAEPAALVS
ncbi:MAG: PTS transporter subunit EIIB [Bifidobacteriaceae bacterium]|nr:PTS transporter subunit EIIB [Bifidobacteriaceae bacterium]